jgi:hypothetical protein
MNAVSKAYLVAAVSCMVLVGCSKVRGAPRTISAKSDETGMHPGGAAVTGPVHVTCVTAVSDTGSEVPPTCVVTAPGTDGVVGIGKTVATNSAGTVTLTCKGEGALKCTARIDQ